MAEKKKKIIEDDYELDLKSKDEFTLKKEEDKVIKKEEKLIKENIKYKEKNNSFEKIDVTKIMIASTSLFGLIYYIYYVITTLNSVDYFHSIVNATFMLLIFECLTLITLVKERLKKTFAIAMSLLIIIFLIFNIIVKANLFSPPKLSVLKDYTKQSLITVINDCKKNNIDLTKTYEYSDNISEGDVISQDVLPKTVLKDVKELSVVVSSGPNYDKEVMLTDFVGLKTDELLKFVEKNKLSSVTMNFDISNEIEKDLIVSQSMIGKIKRNQPLTFNISLGSKDNLKPIKLEDLKNKSIFDASLYLKRNGIKYEIIYEFSKDVKKNYVIKQNKTKGETINPLSDTVILTVSQGTEIKVPEFNGKTSDDVLNWIVKYNLLVEFIEKHDVKVSKGGLIGINYKTGDSITEGTKIKIYTSLGPIVIPKFNSLADLRAWAQNNNINITESYAYNDTVAKGKIVKLSIPSGTAIDPTKTSITVTVSQGKAVIVPYFINKTKSEIQTLCRNTGLNCTFYYTGFSNVAKNKATRQNVSSGARVVSGTYVNIGLSSGQPRTYRVFILGEWFQSSADNTIAVLRQKLGAAAPGVHFNFVKKAANTGFSGQIHELSPVKGGRENTFIEGRTYTIYIVA